MTDKQDSVTAERNEGKRKQMKKKTREKVENDI